MICGLIGKSLVHSYSKGIHEALGMYEYKLFSLSPKEMESFIAKGDFKGLNVTIPYKQAVIPLCDEISPLAEKIGAVNTLYFKESKGKKILVGHNTDYDGFLYAAQRASIDFKDKKILILGNGGTSLTARYAAKDKGATKVYIATRKLNNTYQELTKDFNIITYDHLSEIADDIDIIINTTPVGTYPNTLEKVISLEPFKSLKAVMDVIYNPFKTALILEAEKLGIKYTNGLPMLVAQATEAAGFFMQNPGAFKEKNEEIISQLTKQMQNIVLTGMPGCGKSTIGKYLSKETGMPLIDLDKEIVKESAMTIPEIFEKEGESGFRKRESEIAAKFGKEHGIIIATGGGTILKEENRNALRQNGLIVYIKRPRYALATKGRPLSSDPNALKKLEKERIPIYESTSDITFDNTRSQSKNKVVQRLIKQLNLK